MKGKAPLPYWDDVGTVYIYGNYYKLQMDINDEKQKTVYIDPNTLMIVYPDLKDGDSFSVYQQNSDEHVLSKTEPFVYNQEEMQPSSTKAQTTKDKSKKTKSKSSKKKKKEK